MTDKILISIINETAIKLLNRANEAEEKAEAAEDSLRDIAYFLGCGGYNDVGLVEFDPAAYAKKIKEAITDSHISMFQKTKKSLSLNTTVSPLNYHDQ